MRHLWTLPASFLMDNHQVGTVRAYKKRVPQASAHFLRESLGRKFFITVSQTTTDIPQTYQCDAAIVLLEAPAERPSPPFQWFEGGSQCKRSVPLCVSSRPAHSPVRCTCFAEVIGGECSSVPGYYMWMYGSRQKSV